MIQKIYSKMASIQHDKLLHFFYGYFLFQIGALLLDPLSAMVAVLVLVIIKEAYDSRTHKPDPLDLVFTMIPAVVGVAITKI